MSEVNQMLLRVVTDTMEGAGTDGEVYLGVMGREFHINTEKDDFEKGSDEIFILGEGSNLERPKDNDPRSPVLDTGDLDLFPVYIRFEHRHRHEGFSEEIPIPEDEWYLREVHLTVNPGPQQRVFSRVVNPLNASRPALRKSKGMWDAENPVCSL